YSAATSHPFLTSAASLSLPAPRLAFWLSQDRIYASQAYPRFIAQLITKIPLDPPPAAETQELATHTLKVLVDCLTNIVREIAFFDDTARNYGLDIGGPRREDQVWVERKATRDYTAEMARVAALGSLEEGLVFLWAMEKVYLDAWSSVYNSIPNTPISESELTAKAIKELSYNWSSANSGFAEFVKAIGDLVDAYFASTMSSDALARAEAIWARVVELEAEFWPADGEEVMMR
ncbi:heme oxygenase-like protein, partial [Gyrodon lividus]